MGRGLRHYSVNWIVQIEIVAKDVQNTLTREAVDDDGGGGSPVQLDTCEDKIRF